MGVAEFLRSFRTSCSYALRGLSFALRSQRHLRLHMLAAAVVLLAALFLHFRRVEWILLLLTGTLVILAELLNTAMEFALNLVEARDHPVVRAAKDIAAGAVLLVAFVSAVIGLFLFGPRLLLLVRSWVG